MPRHAFILLSLLFVAAISVDLCVGLTSPIYFVGQAAIWADLNRALPLSQLNLLITCAALTRPRSLAAILLSACALAFWTFLAYVDATRLDACGALLIGSEAMLAGWALRTAGFRLLVPGAKFEPALHAAGQITLGGLFTATTLAAMVAWAMKESAKFDDWVLAMTIWAPGFLVTAIVMTWACLSDGSWRWRFALVLLTILALSMVCTFTAPHLERLPFRYAVCVAIPLIVLRQAGCRWIWITSETAAALPDQVMDHGGAHCV